LEKLVERNRLEDLQLKWVGWKGVTQNHITADEEQGRAIVNAVINRPFP
jgi:hypothetical protein